jgi:hypothetical protein
MYWWAWLFGFWFMWLVVLLAFLTSPEPGGEGGRGKGRVPQAGSPLPRRRAQA